MRFSSLERNTVNVLTHNSECISFQNRSFSNTATLRLTGQQNDNVRCRLVDCYTEMPLTTKLHDQRYFQFTPFCVTRVKDRAFSRVPIAFPHCPSVPFFLCKVVSPESTSIHTSQLFIGLRRRCRRPRHLRRRFVVLASSLPLGLPRFVFVASSSSTSNLHQLI